MKKYPLVSKSIAFAALILASCRKENVTPVTPTVQPTPNNLARVAPTGLQVKLSPYGFLVLDDSASLVSYTRFIDSNSAQDVRDYLNSIGFESQVSVAGQADNYFAPSESNGEYLFNESGIVQIGNFVVRGVASKGYFLAMPVSSLNDHSYSQLKENEFNPAIMCRLKVAGEYGQDINDYIKTHIGQDDAEDPIPNPPTPQARKLFGWEKIRNGNHSEDNWYFLGIRFIHHATDVVVIP